MNDLTKIYQTLFKYFGPQGWWPLLDCEGKNPTKTGAMQGYHPSNFKLPTSNLQRFEICIGAILTQNTSWVQVEKALQNLKKLNALSPEAISTISENKLKEAIKPAGYFNQKAKKLKLFADFFISLKGKVPTREQLLSVWGVGPETADSILLYAFHQPYFVIDAYTKRIFSRYGLFTADHILPISYHELQNLFHNDLSRTTGDRTAVLNTSDMTTHKIIRKDSTVVPKKIQRVFWARKCFAFSWLDHARNAVRSSKPIMIQHDRHFDMPKDYKVFNEYHALIVELAKRNCTKQKPKCESCPLNESCKKLI